MSSDGELSMLSYMSSFFIRKVPRDVVCCARQLSAGSNNGLIVVVACRDPPQSGEPSTISSPHRKRSLARWVLEVINTVGVPRTPHESEDCFFVKEIKTNMEAGLAPPVENYGGEWSVFLALASQAGTHQAAPCFL